MCTKEIKMENELKRIAKGYYKVEGTDLEICKDYENANYDWVVTENGKVIDACLTLKEFKKNIDKYLNKVGN